MAAAGWWDRARCSALPPGRVAFFTEDSRAAKSVCRICPVRVECLAAGLYEPAGVWGGLDRRERTALVRLRAHLGGQLPEPACGREIAALVAIGFSVDQVAVICAIDRTSVVRLLNSANERGSGA